MSHSNVGIRFPRNKKGEESTIDFQLGLFAAVSNDLRDYERNDFIARNKALFRSKGYPIFHVQIVKESLKNKESAVLIARKGLDYIHKNFEFIHSDGSVVSLEKEMQNNEIEKFKTETVKSTAKTNEERKTIYSVKYNGKVYTDNPLCDLIDDWVYREVMEPDCGAALRQVALSHRPALNAVSLKSFANNVFVLIGAGSAMCPFDTLVEMGATIVAIDIQSERVWRRLIEKAESSPEAEMYYPIEKDGNVAGCDLLKNPAEVLNWLKSLPVLKEKTVTIGNYTYLDGARHVMLSAVVDGIIQGLSEFLDHRLNVAFLCTPTDVSPVSEDVFYAANDRYGTFHAGTPIERAIHYLSMKTQLRKNDIKAAGSAFVYNGLAVAQGPNYALAKLVQLWRAVVHFSAEKGAGRVSLNVAPATATLSVVHVKKFKWVFEGLPYFEPIEIFKPETSSSAMAGLLLKDILTEEDIDKDMNPVLLKSQQAFHGGAWRCAYSQNTIGFAALMVRFLGGPRLFVKVVALIFLIPALLLVLFK